MSDDSEYELGIGKVESMSFQIGLALRLIPLESHLQSVYTLSG